MPKLKLTCIIFILLCYSCSNNSFNVQVVRHSAELLTCDKIFAGNLEAIEERNEILLQTGSIDTTDEQTPIKSAIVTIGKNEIALTLIKATTLNNETTERYQGKGYTLTLTYQNSNSQSGKLIYTGKFVIENSKSRRAFEVQGKNCTL
jgi:hypothetical protein